MRGKLVATLQLESNGGVLALGSPEGTGDHRHGGANRAVRCKYAGEAARAEATKRDQVKDHMRDDIEQGRRTQADLRKMSEKELLNAYPYCKSRHTVREARKGVVAEIVEN